MDTATVAKDNTIYEVVTGSTAYHLNTPTSDVDIRGIFIAPPEATFGLNIMEGYRPSGEDDREFKSLREAFHQWTIGTINWLELLWVDDDMVKSTTEETLLLRTVRTMFTSKRTIHKAIGYMNGMIKRAEQSERNDNPNIHKEIMHGVRIGHMMSEFLYTDILTPNRQHERNYLLSIKEGKISVADATKEAQKYITILENKLEKCTWPDTVDMEKANKLLMKMYFYYWKNQGWVGWWMQI